MRCPRTSVPSRVQVLRGPFVLQCSALVFYLLTSPVGLWGDPVAPLQPTRLRCEYRVNPAGLDVRRPRLSWVLEGSGRGRRQAAYQVVARAFPAAPGEEAALWWDSGKVPSDATVHVEYAGRPLSSRAAVAWRVRVWDEADRVSDWSEPATWSMGLLDPGDWQAAWIADAASERTNGVRRPHNGYHSALGAEAERVEQVTVDLGEVRLLDGLGLWPARPYDWQPDTPGFLFPLRFRLEVADDASFAGARVVLDRSAADVPNPGTNVWRATFPAVAGRHVRLSVTRLRDRGGGECAFALAELELTGQGTNVAGGAVVQGAGSIESGGWRAAALVDGVTGTVPPGPAPAALPATHLRREFTVDGSRRVRQATAWSSALGLYELSLNGQRVGGDLLAPEWTSYRRRVHVRPDEVTGLLQPGTNVVGALLGEGWYAGRLMAMDRFPYGNAPRFLLQLEIEYDDGSRQVVATDPAWRSTTDGAIRSAGIYDGEEVDARRELRGWDRAGYDDRGWDRVWVHEHAGGPALVWQRNEPIRVTRELKPRQVTQPRPGAFVFDLGQNMVGWVRLAATGRAGQTVTLRHAEMLNDDGTLYTANLRGAPQVDRYTPAVDGAFVFEPRFTYHGFRFVEVTGLASAPGEGAVTGRVFHSNSPEVGRFECSDPDLNRLMENVVWTQRANLMSSPNDCPQRDERFGWMGDIQAFAQTAAFNMDLAAFFTKFAQDVRDDQAPDGRFPDFAPHPGNPAVHFSGAPAWADAGVIVPWRAWQNYADDRLLRDHFDSARRWVDFVQTHNPGLVWVTNRGNDYNDWLNGDWVRQQGWPEKGGSVPKEVFATAFFAHSADLVSRMAGVIGLREEEGRYRRLFERIRDVFNQRFVKADGRIEGDTQAGYALALHFDLLPAALRPRATAHLVEGIARYQGHLSTGIQSTHRAMLELEREGQTALAWQLLTNRTFPSWRYMIDNGATTIWERWDGYVAGRGFQDAGMNSFNHWAFGAVGEWMWRHLAGLNPDDAQPGWKHFTIAPRPGGGVSWARARYESVRGPVGVDWKQDGVVFALEVEVPPNTTATVVLPAAPVGAITEGGRPVNEAPGVQGVEAVADQTRVKVGSGAYAFRVVQPAGPAGPPTPTPTP